MVSNGAVPADRAVFRLRAGPYSVLFGTWSTAVAMLVAVGVAVSLARGSAAPLGIDLCWFHRLTELPCPGCGLTRAVCSLARGDVHSAVRLHPFSLLVLPWAVVTLALRLWPSASVLRLRASLERYRSGFEGWYLGLVAAFLGYGLLRLAAVVTGIASWPS